MKTSYVDVLIVWFKKIRWDKTVCDTSEHSMKLFLVLQTKLYT